MAENDPKFVGVAPDDDPVLAKYRAEVEARNAQRKADASRPQLPNLLEADKQYKPGRDQPMSLNEIAQAQANIEAANRPAPGGLRPETVEGLKALSAAARQQTEPVAPKPPEEVRDDVLPPSRIADVDNLELQHVMRNVQRDIINNKEEREAIRARCAPLDITDGLSSGEFTQVVPIIPDRFVVKYRSVSPFEEHAIRALLFKKVSDNPLLEAMDAEIYSLMLLVAAIVSINGNTTPFASHIGPDPYNPVFNTEIFERKVSIISRYPAPMVHSLGTHAYWFDQRVRELFASESLKNT